MSAPPEDRRFTDEERALTRRWLEHWKVAGPALEAERWRRVAALTDDEAWRETQDLLLMWEPAMEGDNGEELLLHQRVFARMRRPPRPAPLDSHSTR